MAQLASFLARRYLNTSDAPRSIRTITILAHIGIGIGAAALMLALIISRGFEREISLKMNGISSDAVICAPGKQLEAQPLKDHIMRWMGPHIAGISPSSTRHVILDTEQRQHVLFLKGIEPNAEQQTTSLGSKLVAPSQSTLETALTEPNSILIGQTLALDYQLKIGDSVTIRLPQAKSKTTLGLLKTTLTVAGIFHIGLEEYDANVAYCSQATLQSICEHEETMDADQVAVSFRRPPVDTRLPWWKTCIGYIYRLIDSEETYQKRQLTKLKLALSGLSVRGWHELYPDLVASLTLEKYAMTIILALIALVASMLMVSLIFMFIQYKMQDIAILRAMGAPQAEVRRIFSRIGLFIVVRSTSIGLICAGLIGWWIDYYKPIQLPDVYYISYLPAALEPIGFIIIFCVAVLMGLLACRIPLKQLEMTTVSQLLRE